MEKIKEPEDFGLLFNCLVRRYLWNFDEELLRLISRTIDRYLRYFSPRTVICAIRDMAEGNSVAVLPGNQDEEYAQIIKALVKRYLAMENDGTDSISRLAAERCFTEQPGEKKRWAFTSKEAFAEWAAKNRLDKGGRTPRWNEDYLPVEPAFIQDFGLLCLASLQYSFGRLTSIPSTCQGFILENIGLLTDESIESLINEINRMVSRQQEGQNDPKRWKQYAFSLRMEMLSREWHGKTEELLRNGAIEGAAIALSNHELLMNESDCARAWHCLDGIKRYLLEKGRNEYIDTVQRKMDAVSKFAAICWEKNTPGRPQNNTL